MRREAGSPLTRSFWLRRAAGPRALAAGLLLLASVLVLLLSFPPAWMLDAGAPQAGRFLAGFYAPEEAAGATFRWSGPDGRLRLHGAGTRPFTLDLRLFGLQRPHRGDSHTLRLAHEARTYATFTLHNTAEWRVYRVLLPPGATTDPLGDALPLELRTASYTPGPGADDGRRLGVALDWLRITPLDAAPALLALPLPRALLLTWLVGIMGYGLWVIGHGPWAMGGVLLLGAALLAFAALSPYVLAWALPATPWTLALATLVLAIGSRRGAIDYRLSALDYRLSALGLALIVVLALALRLYQLDTLPYGLWRDEARHALVALRMLEDPDYRPIYEPRNGVHLPGLGLAPFALALEVWGIHVWSLRTVTALAGALTVLPLYALVRRLSGRVDVALLAAAFLAVSSWHISLSRFSFPTVFDPLLSLSGLWLLLVALAPGETPRRVPLRVGAALLGGVCLGLAAQTYHTGRLAPLAAALLVGLLLAFAPQQWRRWLGVGALGALALALTVSPLVGYALRHPESFNDRVGTVFLLHPEVVEARPPLAVLDASLGRHLLMFNVEGDSNGRHHAPGAPLLDYATGAGFVVGVLLLLRGWRDWRSLFVLGLLALGLLPSLLAVEGPHAMRSIGALPAACIAAALGWLAVARWLTHRLPDGAPHAAARRLPLLVLALALALNVWLYFGQMPTNPRVWVSFYPVHTQVGAYLRERANTHNTADLRHIYVARKLTRNPVFDYLAHDLRVETFASDDLSRPAPPEALFVFSGYTYQEDVRHLRPYLGPDPEPLIRGPNLPGTDAPSFVVYQAR
jgi:hypothetical protein